MKKLSLCLLLLSVVIGGCNTHINMASTQRHAKTLSS